MGTNTNNKHQQNHPNNRSARLKRRLLSHLPLFALLALLALLCFPNLSALTSSTTIDFDVDIAEQLTLYVTDSTTGTTTDLSDVVKKSAETATDPLNPTHNWQSGLIAFTSEPASFTEVSAGIVATTNSLFGYNITMTASNAAATIINSSDATEYYAPISETDETCDSDDDTSTEACAGSFAITTHTDPSDDSETPAALSNAGAWGYSLTSADGLNLYNPVPGLNAETPALLAAVTTNAETRKTITFGFKTSNTAAAGVYNGSVLITAVTNAPVYQITYNINVTDYNTQTQVYIDNIYHDEVDAYTTAENVHTASDLLRVSDNVLTSDGALDSSKVYATSTSTYDAADAADHLNTINVFDVPTTSDILNNVPSTGYTISDSYPGREDPFTYSYTGNYTPDNTDKSYCPIYYSAEGTTDGTTVRTLYKLTTRNDKYYTSSDLSGTYDRPTDEWLLENCAKSATSSYTYSGLSGRVFLGYALDNPNPVNPTKKEYYDDDGNRYKMYQPGDTISLTDLDLNKHHTLYAIWDGYAVAMLASNTLLSLNADYDETFFEDQLWSASNGGIANSTSPELNSITAIKDLGRMLFLVNDNIYNGQIDYWTLWEDETTEMWDFDTSVRNIDTNSSIKDYAHVVISYENENDFSEKGLMKKAKYSIGNLLIGYENTSAYTELVHADLQSHGEAVNNIIHYNSALGEYTKKTINSNYYNKVRPLNTDSNGNIVENSLSNQSKVNTIQKILYVPTNLQNFNQNSRLTDIPETMQSIQNINFDDSFKMFAPLSTKAWFAGGTPNAAGTSLSLGSDYNTIPSTSNISNSSTDGSWYRYVDSDHDGIKDTLQVLGTYTDAFSSFNNRYAGGQTKIGTKAYTTNYFNSYSNTSNSPMKDKIINTKFSYAHYNVDFNYVKDMSYMFYAVRLKPNTRDLNDGQFYEPTADETTQLNRTNFNCLPYEYWKMNFGAWSENISYFLTPYHGCKPDATFGSSYFKSILGGFPYGLQQAAYQSSTVNTTTYVNDTFSTYPYTYPTFYPYTNGLHSTKLTADTIINYNSSSKSISYLDISVLTAFSTESVTNFSHMFDYYFYNVTDRFNFSHETYYHFYNFSNEYNNSSTSTIYDETTNPYPTIILNLYSKGAESCASVSAMKAGECSMTEIADTSYMFAHTDNIYNIIIATNQTDTSYSYDYATDTYGFTTIKKVAPDLTSSTINSTNMFLMMNNSPKLISQSGYSTAKTLSLSTPILTAQTDNTYATCPYDETSYSTDYWLNANYYPYSSSTTGYFTCARIRYISTGMLSTNVSTLSIFRLNKTNTQTTSSDE